MNSIAEALASNSEIQTLRDRVGMQEIVIEKLGKENQLLRDQARLGIAPNKQVAKIRTLQQEVARMNAKLAKVNSDKLPTTNPTKVCSEMKMLRRWYPQTFNPVPA